MTRKEEKAMKAQEAVMILRKHNEWRRYDGPIEEGPQMTDPKILGEAIDTVCDTLERIISQDKL